MALVPEGGEPWIACEWRLAPALTPACPYHEDIRQMFLSILIFSGFWSVVIITMMVIRLTMFGYSMYRPTLMWWLRMNQLEMLFFAAALVCVARTIHSSLLLFAGSAVSPFLLNLFFSLGHSIGAALVTYYWIGVIVSLPQDRIVDEFNALPRIISVSVKLGFTLALLYQPLLFLEGASALFNETNPRLADILLTVSYALWPTLLSMNQVSILYFGRRLIRLIETSIDFHERSTVRDKTILTQLKVTLHTVKPIVTICHTIVGASAGSILVMCIARYYIWRSREWSLILLFAYTYVPMICSIFFASFTFFREVYLRAKHGKDFVRTGNSHHESGSNHQTPKASLVSVRDEEKGNARPQGGSGGEKDVRMGVISSTERTTDDIMDEFIARK